MSRFVIYNDATGNIDKVLEGRTETLLLNISANQLAIINSSANSADNYIDVITGEVKDKSSQTIAQDTGGILADGVDAATFSNVLVGSEVFIDGISKGVTEIADSGIIEITFDTIGAYAITFKLFPYFDSGFTIDAN